MKRGGIRGGVGLVLGLLVAAIPAPAPAGAQGQDDPEGAAPGLVAEYAATPGGPVVARRVEADLTHDWGEARPDPRLPRGPFAARWSGSILVREPGPHRFFVHSGGRVELTVGGRAPRSGDEAEALDLPPGLVPFALEYRHERGPARVAVEWEGPSFGREPLPAWVLFHEGDGPSTDPLEAGRRLADRLGCANCHAVLDLPAHRNLGPPLAAAARDLDRAWLSAWLEDPTRVRPGPRMPAFGDHGLDPRQAADVAAFLAGLPGARPEEPSGELRMALNVADPVAGRLLFRTLGCLGCHTRSGEGIDASPHDRAAPDLADAGRARSVGAIASYLARPGPRVPARHRPDLNLRPDDAAHLGAYLASGASPPAALPERPAGDAGRGRAIVEAYRCAACHDVPGLDPPTPARPLGPGSDPRAGCLADDGRAAAVPRFALRDDRREALRAFVAGLPESPAPTPAWTLAEDAIRRRNCLGCHARDGRGGEGLGSQLAAYLGTDRALGAFKGRLTPPDLTAVGDKLRPDYLASAVRGAAPPARPWLAVRMPTFAFEPGEAEAIAAFLNAHDALSAGPAASRPEAGPPTPPEAAPAELGAALIGQSGFGCASCHVLAGKVPPGGEPETLGPDLALAHRRMTRRYFRRWIADPQRILPGTPMPQFLQPVAALPGTLDDQLDAIWALLGRDRLDGLASPASRQVRRPTGERAEVVYDMILVPDSSGTVRHYPRGVAIGFGNGHSVLFDSDRLSWVAWWRGDFVERTKSGRLWEWHPAGPDLGLGAGGEPPLRFVGPDGEVRSPGEVRERFGSFAGLTFAGRGVVLSYVLLGPDGSPVRVAERLEPIDGGWRREVRVAGLPRGWRPRLTLPAGAAPPEGDRLRWEADGSSVMLVISPRAAGGARGDPPMEPDGEDVFRAELRYMIAPGP